MSKQNVLNGDCVVCVGGSKCVCEEGCVRERV